VTGSIEDYAMIGDSETVGLVGRDGSLDWLCLPRFDSPACFAALLGDEENGHWTIAPAGTETSESRQYVPGSLVLETFWSTDTGTVKVVDFMPLRGEAPDVVRIVHGVSGTVDMRMVLRLRFEYGRRVPWVRRSAGSVVAVAGPDAVYLSSDVQVRGEGMSTVADFTVSAGERVHFVLIWKASHERAPRPVDAERALEHTITGWQEWSSHHRPEPGWSEEWQAAISRSLLTLKALTYQPTGGIVAAATTSLPEDIGGERNWDYRYCWLRDATMTLEALLRCNFTQEAEAWQGWLLRAVAGSPDDLQIMYGIAGETRLTEFEADWLKGYEGSQPVRIGNAAADQLQLDVFGEVIDALALAERHGVNSGDQAWSVAVALVTHLEKIWERPDRGLWEVRGPEQHFTHSKLMCWVSFDRMATLGAERGHERAAHWRELAATVHAQVCERGWNPDVGAFTQSYGSSALDAAVLMIVRTGFLPPDDPRVLSTLDAVHEHLVRDGLLLRYELPAADAGEAPVDGLAGDEGAFLACSFWYAEALALVGRHDEARELFDRLLTLRNDVGLLAEEYDTVAKRQLGNVPQAFSHIGLINTAWALTSVPDPATP
jgi:GH15 family glucan-1,4-alpha-glucosidase